TEERLSRLHSEYRVLKRLVANDPVQARLLEEMRMRVDKAVEVTDRFSPVSSAKRSGAAMISALMANLRNFEAAYDQLDPLRALIRRFREPELFHSPASALAVAKSTAVVDKVVLGSLAGSTLAAVLLFIYFIRSINRGIVTMVENTERFRRGEQLLPPLTGSDELTQVDKAFHAMADEIREAQNTKQAVLATISHDLRTPLTSLLLSFTLLQRDLADASAAMLAGAREQEADIDHLIRLINNLLELEKIEAGRLSIRPEKLPVDLVFEKAIDTVESFAEQREVTVTSADTSLEISADPDRIVQALANLLFAAITVSPRGSQVGLRALQGDNVVEIQVISSRATVSADLVERMFDRYHDRQAGLGLELPMSKEIVRLHGGTIGATAGQPGGFTLWFSLPPPASASTGPDSGLPERGQ
ncbi:MAG TPA: HAMP domain-containing sensor histidine kinase, partial [Candidatus Obscuribacterales bacterium]